MKINVNGKSYNYTGDETTPLLWVIRDTFGLSGTKFGCGMAQCGACTVFIDNMPIRSCVTPVTVAKGKEVYTIEGVKGKQIDALRKAWADLDVPQCGYCQSGQLMSAAALLAQNSKPTDEDIDSAMSGNICRCATYYRIRKGVKQAATILQGGV